MFYLIYVSVSTQAMSDDDLVVLLEKSRKNNLKLDITGILLYKGKSFMQMLEGNKQTVLGLYDKIKQDELHKSIITVMTGNITERNYEQWSMGFHNMNKIGNYPSYKQYIDENLTFKSFQQNAEGAYKFMMLFNEVNQ